MDWYQIAQQNGWWVVLLLFFIDKVWPVASRAFTTVFLPSKAKEAALKLDMQRRIQESELKQKQDEITFRHEVESRTIRALEQVGEILRASGKETTAAMQQVALALVANNERLSALERDHAEHAKFTIQAVGDMVKTVQSIHSLRDKGPT
jgi:hypothetical protein